MNDIHSDLPLPSEEPHQLDSLRPIIGLSPWARNSSGSQQAWQPARATATPLPFSTRAAMAGEFKLAHSLAHLEQVGIRLAASAAPSPLNTATWRWMLTWANYPADALAPLMQAMTEGASVDPAGEATFDAPPSRLANHLSLYGHAEFVLAKLAQQRAAGTLVEWPTDTEPLVVSPLGSVTKCATLLEEQNLDRWEHANTRDLRQAQKRDEQANSAHNPISLTDLGAPRAPSHGKVRIIHDARICETVSLGVTSTQASMIEATRHPWGNWTRSRPSSSSSARAITCGSQT